MPPEVTADAHHASGIQCRSISVDFASHVRAVDEVDLQVPAGQILSLIGPSGCGKTTLLRLMARLHSATSGTVSMEPRADGRRGEIAFVFQQPALLPWRTALENVLLPLQLIGQGTVRSRRSSAAKMLESVGLAGAMDRFPSQLSGGMRMRVSIARALVTEPSVLLLDEPFAAIDDMLRHQLGQLLLDLWQQRRFTAVMVTHNIAEAVLLSHRIVVMRAGRVGPPIDNPLPYPRDESLRRTPEFGEFYGQVSDALREDS